ncbi:phospholipid-binding protein MlaC [Ferrovibrio sp.]|uniref:MlaC/ttg2D family ABC transporter substrate-binding protein n=1 Tax=Ferrovibrio sp. TaxID=1917215 RepID=UPI001B5A888A|nr:ABC transporter substrate-binding protein [Ferrovibrio sp.]MBP7065609.1 ABC transporter substrate-binding protein [Ferrovibrio sp.]
MPRLLSLSLPPLNRLAAGLLLLAGLAFGNATAGRAAEADGFIRKVGAETLEALDRSLAADRREDLVRELLEKHLDLATVSRFCLGRYSRQLTEAQAKEYDPLFVEYLVKVYAGLLAQYDGQTMSVHDGTSRESEPSGTQLVLSQINRKAGPPIRVEWKVVEKGGQPKVTDVIIEGVSMAFTQRQQFESVIQNNGGKVEALFPALRKQISR